MTDGTLPKRRSPAQGLRLAELRVRRIVQEYKQNGALEAAKLTFVRMAIRAVGQTYRRVHWPLLFDLTSFGLTYTSARQLLGDVLVPSGDVTLAQVEDEFGPLQAELERRFHERRLVYPTTFAVADGASFLLYAATRLRQPNVILESGVANGHSTYYLLQALRRNGHGRLYSTDIASDVGVLLDSDEQAHWSLTVLREGHEQAGFAALVDALPPIDLFFHDADHKYESQMWEYTRAARRMSTDAVLLSDDVDSSFAFIDFCARHNVRPALLVEPMKVFGVLPMATIAAHCAPGD